MPGKYNLSKYKRLLAWAVAVACLVYIVAFFKNNSSDLALVLKFKAPALAAIMALHFFYLFFYSLRFQLILLKCSDTAVPLVSCMKLLILGRFLNQIFPQLGNLYRSTTLKRDFAIPYTRYITAYFSLMWLDTLVNFLIAAVVLAFATPEMLLGSLNARNLLFVLVVVTGLVPVAIEWLIRIIPVTSNYLTWLQGKLAEVFRVTISSMGDANYIGRIVLLGALQFVSVGALFYVTFTTMGAEMDLAELAVFYALYKISTHLIISPGNLGLREIAYGFLSEQMGIGMAEGILASAIIRLTGYLFDLIAGPAFGGLELLSRRRDFGNPQETKEPPP